MKSFQLFLRRGGGYVLVQVILLLWIALSGLKRRPVSPSRRRLGTGLGLVGLGLMLESGEELGRNLTALPEPVPNAELITSGLYRHVRHPIYSAVLLLCAGWSIWRGSQRGLGLTGVLAGWFHLKSEYEEAALRERFPGYAAYRHRTKKFIPGVF